MGEYYRQQTENLWVSITINKQVTDGWVLPSTNREPMGEYYRQKTGNL